MTREDVFFHEEWLGMAQPEGLVVSVPVLVEAQCHQRQPAATQHRLRELCPPVDPREPHGPRRIRDVPELLAEMLDLTPDLFDAGDDLPDDLACYVPEGGQTIRPTRALRHLHPPGDAGPPYVMLLWELPDALDLDRPESVTGPWEYLPAHKFDRLLRHTRVPIGLLTNRRVLRLVYAPHGESSGHVDFPVDALADPGGRPLLDAFILLLSARRFFGVQPEHQLPALLRASRQRQAEVTEELAEQVLEALDLLLRGFEKASQRDRSPDTGLSYLDEALRRSEERGDDHVYGGLLTVLLRLVFLLYAESRKLLPVGHALYDRHFSVLGLFDQLQRDQGRYPDSMADRFGAWGRLLALFRAVYEGGHHGDFHLPQRHGPLFDPSVYPFLEGRAPGTQGTFPHAPEERAAVRIPSLDDGTVYRVLERLVILDGQRLSFEALDVEQIGSVYEALMGYHVVRVHSPAVRLGKRAWVPVAELLERAPNRRAKWLQEVTGLAKKPAQELARAVNEAEKAEALNAEARVLAALRANAGRSPQTVEADRLVIQPGAERRRTSSHYTPRSLSAPIVARTLEPLLATLGPEPSSDQILALKVCDPAMGSGAFLAEACRFLADRLVEAWEREGTRQRIAEDHDDPTVHARRLVAQRCLYGVDRNPFAVELAKLSLWLLTLARDLPFTFLDHNLRHGDSLVGLDLEQIRAFHWDGEETQQHLASQALDQAVREAVRHRREILELAEDDSEDAQRRKEWLLEEADDALRRARLLGDLAIGAFFAETTKTKRKKELGRRLALVDEWLRGDDHEIRATLRGLQEEIRERVPIFHWMLELPEVFLENRPDPLAGGRTEGKAWMDGFVGNPPFLGGKRISTEHGDAYAGWLAELHGTSKNADLAAHFFRRTGKLLGDHGTLGLIATNTIAQGDTRVDGLKSLVEKGFTIYEAVKDMPWPGTGAAVTVSVVYLVKGSPTASTGSLLLDGREVEVINSRLRPSPERPDPSRLKANRGLSFQGAIIVGTGFLLSPDERDHLVAREPRNAERILPYLGGVEINRNPDQGSERYVINFGALSLEAAGQWPDLLGIVRKRVKPVRDKVKRAAHRRYWWHFGDKRPALFRALKSLDRCLITCRVTKHLSFTFQPTNYVFSDRIYVFPIETPSAFSVLQSRLHEVWARLLSSTLKTDLNYSASDCFETFPFPEPDPRAEIPELEAAGERLYERRVAHMLETQQGLTDTYNRLKDPEDDDPAIEELRRLHDDLDRAVLAAYGWEDIAVPPYRDPRDEAEELAFQTFEDEILDRLFALNEKRAKAEREEAARRQAEAKRKAGKRGREKDPAQGELDL